MLEQLVLLIGVALVPAIVLHEYAHGWAAFRLGDMTAKSAGRLTLNPIKHIDLVGSVIIPGILVFSYFAGINKHLFLFGWAKPVPVNFLKLRNPRRDMMIVAAAGPLTNLILAGMMAQMIRWMGSASSPVTAVLLWAMDLNLTLAVFNMLPIPPLDGSRIVTGILPGPAAVRYNRLEPYGIFIVLVLLQFGLLSFIHPMVDYLAQFLGVRL